MDTRTQTIQAKTTNSSGLQTVQTFHIDMGGLGGCPQNLNPQADRDKMAKKRRKQKPLLSGLEQDIAILHKNKFDLDSLEELRQSLLGQYIRRSGDLTSRQKAAVHKLAAPLRSQSKKVKTDRRRKKHYVYAISDGAFVKIGLAVNPKKRLGDLQVASPSVLKIEATIECSRYSGASKLEKQLHRACRKYHIRGEWFEMDAMCIFDNFT